VRVGNLDRAVARAEAQIAHYAHVVQHSIATTLPRLGNLERTAINARSLPKWLKRHLVALLAGGILLRALSRIGLGWLKCRNVTKTAKRVCGLDKGFLDALLAGTILIAGTISLREFAKEVEDITEEASDLIHGFLRDA